MMRGERGVTSAAAWVGDRMAQSAVALPAATSMAEGLT